MHTLKLAWTWGTTLSIALLHTLHQVKLPSLRRVEMTIYVAGEAHHLLDGLEIATKIMELCGDRPYSVKCVAVKSQSGPTASEANRRVIGRMEALLATLRRTGGEGVEISSGCVTQGLGIDEEYAGTPCW